MSRHSKNNTGSSIFTYGERQKLKNLNEWGEIKSRIGADSQKKFEQCSLCLNLITNPVCCLKGHVYCKECIIQNMLYQKKQNKERESELQDKGCVSNEMIKLEENKKKIDQLKQIEENVQVEEKDNDKDKDNEDVNEILQNKQFVKGKTHNCFWIPEQTPKNKNPIKSKSTK